MSFFFNIDSLNLSYLDTVAFFKNNFNLTPYYAKIFYKQLYCCFNTIHLPKQITVPLPVLPKPEKIQTEEGNIKFTLQFAEDVFSETVIIKMKNYTTLCVSSQTGCKWGCVFCQTGKLGFKHNLSTAQIIAQYMVAKYFFKADISNIVFMGMGEALDNFDAVIKAIDIFSHPYGINLATAHITISTVGSVANLEKLGILMQTDIDRAKNPLNGQVAPTAYRNLRVAVSLNASNNTIRSSLMPVNLKYAMDNLKQALKAMPLKRKYHDLFIEYVLIPGFNDGEQHAKELVTFLSDLPCVVNLIEYNPPLFRQTTLLSGVRAPTEEEVNTFFNFLVNNHQVVRRRHKRGSTIGAACGCLGMGVE